MAAELAFWAFLALVQGLGIVGSATGSLETCQEARQEMLLDPDVLAVEECHEVKLIPVQHGEKA